MHFIEIEGITGSGKTTIIPFLQKYLTNKGYSVFCVKEPGFTDLGLDIRQILGNAHHGKLSNLTQMFLFLANRADIYEKHIKKCRSDIILFDRFYGSTVVYQILIGDHELKEANLTLLDEAMKRITGRSKAVDTTILFDLDPKVALERIKIRQKTEIRSQHETSNDAEFLKFNADLRQSFKNYFFNKKGNTDRVLIDANKTVESVVNQCEQALSVIEFDFVSS